MSDAWMLIIGDPSAFFHSLRSMVPEPSSSHSLNSLSSLSALAASTFFRSARMLSSSERCCCCFVRSFCAKLTAVTAPFIRVDLLSAFVSIAPAAPGRSDGSSSTRRRSALLSSLTSMAPEPSGSKVSKSSSMSDLGTVTPSSRIALTNSFLLTSPLPSSSHSRNRSMTRAEFLARPSCSCCCTGTSDSRSSSIRTTDPFFLPPLPPLPPLASACDAFTFVRARPHAPAPPPPAPRPPRFLALSSMAPAAPGCSFGSSATRRLSALLSSW